MTDYVSTLKVVDEGGNVCRVEWSGRFTPNGVSDQEASKLFQGIYEDGLKALSAELAKETT